MNLFKNLDLKLISLVVATILWVMVTGKDYRYGDFNIPIELKGLPENLVITRAGVEDKEIKNATVRIRASETIIRTLDERSMFLRVDISNLGAGHHPVPLTEDMVTGRPPGAEITDIFPSVLELDIEEMLILPLVEVNPEILGKPADNYDISRIICTPSRVSVRGPKSIVQQIEKISTPPVNVEGLAETVLQRTLRLIPPHPQVSVNPEAVDLRIEISEKVISKSFRKIPVEIRGARYVTQINPRTLGVWVKGPISEINKLAAENIKVFVTLTGDEPRLKNISLNPQSEFVPADSFPNVQVKRFSQSYVDLFLTNKRIKQ